MTNILVSLNDEKKRLIFQYHFLHIFIVGQWARFLMNASINALFRRKMATHSDDWMKILLFVLIFIRTANSSYPALPNTNFTDCRDVSFYDELDFYNDECPSCQTVFERICSTKKKRICEKVPQTRCRLIGYTDCKLELKVEKYNETVLVPNGTYVPYECMNKTRTIYRKIEVPHCVNQTRLDCVTKWELDPAGRKVWAGNEACSPIQWQNCTIVMEQVAENETFTECLKIGKPIPYAQCEYLERTRETSGLKCQIKHSLTCECTERTECITVQYEECEEVAKLGRCEKIRNQIPFQRKIHRVKCLFDED